MFLKNHPFPVEAFFRSSLVLTFSAPKEELQKFIPDCLELDVFDDKFAFLAVALVDTFALRPKGFPEFLGNDFFLIGYRIFVRYTDKSGKRMRGLYILKSETDKRKMSFLGNVFTHYNYETTDILHTKHGAKGEIKSAKSNLDIAFEEIENAPLPENSPFADWKQARRFAGPLPFTFTYNAKENTVLIIEGVRENWTPKPVKINRCNIEFLQKLKIKNLNSANAFIIKNIPYYWKSGKIEHLQK